MRVYRYELPVDGTSHHYSLASPPLHVASVQGRSDLVEFWAEYNNGVPELDFELRVFGTGRVIDNGAIHIGSTLRNKYGFVWHVYWMNPNPDRTKKWPVELTAAGWDPAAIEGD